MCRLPWAHQHLHAFESSPFCWSLVLSRGSLRASAKGMPAKQLYRGCRFAYDLSYSMHDLLSLHFSLMSVTCHHSMYWHHAGCYYCLHLRSQLPHQCDYHCLLQRLTHTQVRRLPLNLHWARCSCPQLMQAEHHQASDSMGPPLPVMRLFQSLSF